MSNAHLRKACTMQTKGYVSQIKDKGFFGSIAFISLLFALWLEFQAHIPKYFFITLPLITLLMIYNLFSLLCNLDKVKVFFISLRGTISLICFLFFIALCYTPSIIIPVYVRVNPSPFRNYHWLAVSFVEILFSISLLNYLLCHPEGLWLKIVSACKAVWRLQTKYFLLLFTLMIFIITNFFSWKVFEHIPHVQDEISQFFQAKIFSMGNITAPLPPIIDFFQYRFDNIIFTDRWYSQYPPGHPFFLLLGLLLKIPWIINPFFGTLSCILLYNVALQYYGEREARLSVILFAISPFALFMSSSFMNHVTTLFFMLLFIYTFNKFQHNNSSFLAIIAGLSLGTMLNIRPQEALVIGVLYGMFYLMKKPAKKNYLPLLAFITTVAIMAGILLLYNYKTTGDPFLFGYQVRWGRGHAFGFSSEPIAYSPPHTPLRGLVHTLSNFFALNQYLFEWPLPSLIPLVIFWTPFFFKKNSCDYRLFWGFLAAPIIYFFYYFQDLCLGPRLYYISLPFIIILTAKALFQIIQGISSLRSCSEKYIKNAVIALLFLSVVFSCLVRMPQLYHFYADSFWGVDDKPMKKAKEMGIKNAVIFLKINYYDSKGFYEDYVGSGFLHNSPYLNDSIIFARDLGVRNSELLPFFPGRSFYIASKNEKGEIIIEQLRIH